MSATSTTSASTVAVRCRDGCTMCCKITRIDTLQKPRGVWCKHCKPGWGLPLVYANKPQECSTFLCGYLTDPRLARIGSQAGRNSCW